MKRKIYIDQDGVLFDFDRGLFEKFGIKNCILEYNTPWDKKTLEQKESAKAKIDAMNQSGFFYDLPPMEGYWELYRAAGPESYILTAYPGFSNDKRNIEITDEKKRSAFKYLSISPERVLVVKRAEKAKYAKGNILIDDLEKNIREWTKAGGIGILFKNYKQAIKELNDITN